ncbi:4-hydroxybenzoate polyprenyltransferase [Roseivivax halotolerans]|uniref:4-hydroxybenzoate polyprenyltransferase n=1 Tax=Roseivivax halotolerans TaxID=93684 RepID=A0A1I6A508_9RHOB|nr:UbiA family prenyltransferase [Roseivivax halotolerans]SFQ63814.1 4-hydroxybenzoate polyprenyltransferase [Roseivivax halotolerans]
MTSTPPPVKHGVLTAAKPPHCPLNKQAGASTGVVRLSAEAIDLASTPDVPLVIDLDGTLLRSDLLVETMLRHVASAPMKAPDLLRAARHGKAAVKAHLADAVHVDPANLPYDGDVLALARRARLAGRPVYLASGSHARFVAAIAEYLDLFDGWLATEGDTNLTGPAKAAKLRDRFGTGRFDYIGNEAADLPVWKAARRAFAVRTSRRVTAQMGEVAGDATLIDQPSPGLSVWTRQLRVHQYAKNVLVFVPMIAGHALTIENVVLASLAALAFCMAASACYILNDIVDLQEDRAHHSKRNRPLARGDMSITHAVLAIPVLLLMAAAVSLAISPVFALVLAIYFATTTAYSFILKRILLIDVLTLAGLYTVRMLGGSVAVGIALSSWLVVFSLSIFVSLALMKRFTELAALVDANKPSPSNRDYETLDLGMLAALSAAAGFNAVTVLALYVSGSSVSTLYSRPEVLLLACPILTYWIGRALILAQRRQMADDPVLFAIKDPQSRITGISMLGVFIAAI